LAGGGGGSSINGGDDGVPPLKQRFLDGLASVAAVADTSFGGRPSAKSARSSLFDEDDDEALLPLQAFGGGDPHRRGQPPNGMGQRSASQGKVPIASIAAMPKLTAKSKVKIEPKTFFANERTYIQWLGVATLLVAFTGQMMTTSKAGRTVGTMLWPIGLLIVCYALAQYHWRLRRIIRRDPRGYDDRYGPTFLAAVMVAMMITILVVAWSSKLPDTANPAAVAGGVVAGGGGRQRRWRRTPRGLMELPAFGGGPTVFATFGRGNDAEIYSDGLSNSLSNGANGDSDAGYDDFMPENGKVVGLAGARSDSPSAAGGGGVGGGGAGRVCMYEAAADRCVGFSPESPPPLTVRGAGGQLTLITDWSPAWVGERTTREAAVSLVESGLRAMAAKHTAASACADLHVVARAVVRHERTMFRSTWQMAGGVAGVSRRVVHEPGVGSWLETRLADDGSSAAARSVQADGGRLSAFNGVSLKKKHAADDLAGGAGGAGGTGMVLQCIRTKAASRSAAVAQSIGAASATVVPAGAARAVGAGVGSGTGQYRHTDMPTEVASLNDGRHVWERPTAAEVASITGADPVGSTNWGAPQHFVTVHFNVTLASSAAEVVLKIEYPSAKLRALSANASAASLSVSLSGGGTMTSRYQAPWLLQRLTEIVQTGLLG
jgi:uncharacterized membrane protein YidH (DUF202 family)